MEIELTGRNAVVTGIAHEGSNSLHIVATGLGGSLGTVQNVISNLFSTNVATISFWFLPSTNGSGINFLRRYATARVGVGVEARMRELLFEAYLREKLSPAGKPEAAAPASKPAAR